MEGLGQNILDARSLLGKRQWLAAYCIQTTPFCLQDGLIGCTENLESNGCEVWPAHCQVRWECRSGSSQRFRIPPSWPATSLESCLLPKWCRERVHIQRHCWSSGAKKVTTLEINDVFISSVGWKHASQSDLVNLADSHCSSFPSTKLLCPGRYLDLCVWI